jgi:gas vesicle protein
MRTSYAPASPLSSNFYHIEISGTKLQRSQIMSENNSCSIGTVLTAFAVGALAGATIALLYAPQSGEDTRKMIAKKGKEYKGKAHEVIEDAKDFFEGKKAEITAAVEAGKEAMREERAKHQKHA